MVDMENVNEDNPGNIKKRNRRVKKKVFDNSNVEKENEMINEKSVGGGGVTMSEKSDDDPNPRRRKKHRIADRLFM